MIESYKERDMYKERKIERKTERDVNKKREEIE